VIQYNVNIYLTQNIYTQNYILIYKWNNEILNKGLCENYINKKFLFY